MKILFDLVAGIISMIAKSLGVSYATANVAWSFYLQGLVCILSCLLLLIPMRKRYKQFGLDVFTISGTASILGYAYLIFANWFNFIRPFIGLSFETQHKILINYTKMTGMHWHMSYQSVYLILFVFLGVAIIGMNIILLIWLNRLAKKTSYDLMSFPALKQPNIQKKHMTKKCIISVLLVAAWAFFASLFYKTIIFMLLFLVWKKNIFEMLPTWAKKWGIRPYWILFFVCLWMAMPRYLIESSDRVKLVYLDKNGDTKHPPLTQYLINTLIPEEEIVNFGIRNLMIGRPILSMMGVGGTLIAQANQDIANGKIHNFFTPYDNLGMDNPMSGVYVQAFNEAFGTNDRAVYICEPKGDENVRWSKENGFKYPLVVFCHGYLGNWQLYQGIWKDLDNCIVLSIGTRSMSGIFTNSDINEIFSYYIPSLERMGYHIDHQQIHLMGLSNGGSAIVAAMHSSHAKDFKSLTSISCNLGGLRKVPCNVNLIGGGEDNSSLLMPSQASRLSKMGVHTELFFVPEENHFVLVNRRNEIIKFLKQQMNLTCVRE